jgi:uncharacterized membrane protein YjfL (UPF0719 family)
MGLNEGLIALGLAFVQLIVGLVLALVTIYIGVNLYDRLTKGLDEQEELKKGNVAVGIVLAAVILSIANVIQSGVSGLTTSIGNEVNIFGIAMGLAQVLFGLVMSVISIYLSITVLDKITKDINEMEELKKGNVAVAIVIAGVLLAVSFVVQSAIRGFGAAGSAFLP